MTDKTRYILKGPITAEEDARGYLISNGEYEAVGKIEKYIFKDLFTPLDVETIRQQIADIMDELGEYRDVEAYFRKQEEAVDAVLALVYPDNKEETL